MPNFTQNAIRNSFIKLLNEKPLSQITVKDIVEDCGINRNSFYYHFADIPTLIEDIVKSDFDKVLEEHTTVDSLEECLLTSVDFARKNKRAVMHIFNSVNRDMFEHYLWQVTEYVVNKYIDTVVTDKKLNERDSDLLKNLLKCECFGLTIAWMNSGMPESISDDIKRLAEMRNGLLEEIIKRISEI